MSLAFCWWLQNDVFYTISDSIVSTQLWELFLIFFTGTMRLLVTKHSDFFSAHAFPRTVGDGKRKPCWATTSQKAESKRMPMGEIRKPLPIQKFILGCIVRFSSADMAYTGKSILHPIQPCFRGQLCNIPVLQTEHKQLHMQITAQLPRSEWGTFFHTHKQQSLWRTEPAVIKK